MFMVLAEAASEVPGPDPGLVDALRLGSPRLRIDPDTGAVNFALILVWFFSAKDPRKCKVTIQLHDFQGGQIHMVDPLRPGITVPEIDFMGEALSRLGIAASTTHFRLLIQPGLYDFVATAEGQEVCRTPFLIEGSQPQGEEPPEQEPRASG